MRGLTTLISVGVGLVLGFTLALRLAPVRSSDRVDGVALSTDGGRSEPPNAPLASRCPPPRRVSVDRTSSDVAPLYDYKSPPWPEDEPAADVREVLHDVEGLRTGDDSVVLEHIDCAAPPCVLVFRGPDRHFSGVFDHFAEHERPLGRMITYGLDDGTHIGAIVDDSSVPLDGAYHPGQRLSEVIVPETPLSPGDEQAFWQAAETLAAERSQQSVGTP